MGKHGVKKWMRKLTPSDRCVDKTTKEKGRGGQRQRAVNETHRGGEKRQNIVLLSVQLHSQQYIILF